MFYGDEIRSFWRFCVDARLFCTRQDRFLNGVLAKCRELAQVASISTISRRFEVVEIFISNIVFQIGYPYFVFAIDLHPPLPRGFYFRAARRTSTSYMVTTSCRTSGNNVERFAEE